MEVFAEMMKSFGAQVLSCKATSSDGEDLQCDTNTLTMFAESLNKSIQLHAWLEQYSGEAAFNSRFEPSKTVPSDLKKVDLDKIEQHTDTTFGQMSKTTYRREDGLSCARIKIDDAYDCSVCLSAFKTGFLQDPQQSVAKFEITDMNVGHLVFYAAPIDRTM